MKGKTKMGKRLYGYVSKENIEYEWKSESGACEVCQGLNGTIYDSANDIPDRLHPNCKCHIEILEKDTDTTDPIEIRREKIKDRKRKELELAKLMGDLKSLEQEIDEYIKRLDEQDREVEKFESIIDAAKLEQKDRQKLSEVKEKIDYAKYKGGKAKKDISILKDKIATTETIEEISKVKYELQKLRQYTENLITEAKLKIFTLGIDVIGSINQHDAVALWNISVDGLQYDNKYIKENGKIYNTVSDLKDYKLEKTVQDKIQKQMGVSDSRGIVFDKDSSLSKAVQNSDELRKFITDNKNTLIKTGTLENKSISFNNGNLKNALHNVDVIETYIDTQGNLHTKILDTYDYNPNEKDWKVKIARELQEKNKIQTYYTITEIVLPKNVWINY